MNKLLGEIINIETHDSISLVKIRTKNNLIFTSIVLDTPETVDYLKLGNSVKIYFKETEVIISKDINPNISIQNRIPCRIKSLKIGELLGQINLIYNEIEIKSIITKNACKQLDLKENDEVLALIKTNEVSLSPND